LGKQEKSRFLLMANFAGVIVKHQNSILLGRRADNGCAYAGYWSIPAGMVEGEESTACCAKRELFEETGIVIEKPLRYLCEFKDGEGMFYVYLHESEEMEFPDPKAEDSYEHTEWGYFNLDKNFFPEPISKEIIDSILKLIKND